MDIREDIKEFLRTRRARITPAQAGLPAYGTNRRVKGLRREEVAMLAGISVEYYTRLERGNAAGVSDGVIEGLVRALQLDEAERLHLADLVRAANARRPEPRPLARRRVRPTVQRILDSLVDAAAVVRNERFDILAANELGRAFYAPVFDSPYGPPNLARFCFLDPAAADFFDDWEQAADDVVAILRAAAGRDPFDRSLTDLVGQLSTRSEAFRSRWAAHDVKLHRSGVKKVHHPVVGNLEVDYEALILAADVNLRMNVYTAAPDTPTHAALRLLASWAASERTASR